MTAGGRIVTDPLTPRVASPRDENMVYAHGHAFPRLTPTNLPSWDCLRRLEGSVVVLEGKGFALVRQGEFLNVPSELIPTDQNSNPARFMPPHVMAQPPNRGNQHVPAYVPQGDVSHIGMANQYPFGTNAAPGNAESATMRQLGSLQIAYQKHEDEYKQLDKNEVLVNQRETLTKESKQAYTKRRMELTNHMNDIRLSIIACKARLGMDPSDNFAPSAGAGSNYPGYFQNASYPAAGQGVQFVPPPHVQQQMAMHGYQPLAPHQVQFGAPHVQMVQFEEGEQFGPNQASYGQGFSYPPVAPRWGPMQLGQTLAFPDVNEPGQNVLRPRTGGENIYGNALMNHMKPAQNSNAVGGLQYDGTKQSDPDMAPSFDDSLSMPAFQTRRRSCAVEIRKPPQPESAGKKKLNPATPEYQPIWAIERNVAAKPSQHHHVQSMSSQGTVTGPRPSDKSNRGYGQHRDGMASEQASFNQSVRTESSATTCDFFPQSAKAHSLPRFSIDDVAPSPRMHLDSCTLQDQDVQLKDTPPRLSSKNNLGPVAQQEPYAKPSNSRDRPDLSIRTGQVPSASSNAVAIRGSEGVTHASSNDGRSSGRVSRVPNYGHQTSHGLEQEQYPPASQYQAGYACGMNKELMPEATTLDFRTGYLHGIVKSSTPGSAEVGAEAVHRQHEQVSRVASVGRSPSMASLHGPAPPSNSRESPLRHSFTTDENQPQSGRQGHSGESIVQRKSSQPGFKYPWEIMLEKRESRSSLREKYRDEASPLASRFGSPNVVVVGEARGSSHVTPSRAPNSAPTTTGYSHNPSFVKRDTDFSETGNNHPAGHRSASGVFVPPGFGGDLNTGAAGYTPTRNMSSYESQRYYPGKVQSSVAPSATYAKGCFPQYDGSADDDENTSKAPAGSVSGDKNKKKPAGGLSAAASPSKVTSGNAWFGGPSALKSPDKQSKGKSSISSSPMKRASSAVVKLLQFGTGSSSGSWRKDQQQGRRAEQEQQQGISANVGAGGGGGSPSVVGGASRAPATMGGDSAGSPRTVPGQYPASTYETPSGRASVFGGEAAAEPPASAWSTNDANNGWGNEVATSNEGWGNEGTAGNEGWGDMGHLPTETTTIARGGNSYGGNRGGRGAAYAKKKEEAKAEWEQRFADLMKEEKKVVSEQQRKESQGRGGRGFGPGAYGAGAPNM